jgi:hypothetical protein
MEDVSEFGEFTLASKKGKGSSPSSRADKKTWKTLKTKNFMPDLI